MIKVICNYCNNSWKQYHSKQFSIDGLKCTKCGEIKSLKVIKDTSESVDYYIGTLPFDPKPLTLKDFDDEPLLPVIESEEYYD